MNMSIRRLSSNEYYESSDLSLVTTLSLYYPLETIDHRNPQKAVFIFKRDKQMDQLINAYWRGELKVNPQAYFNALKNMKARLYENR